MTPQPPTSRHPSATRLGATYAAARGRVNRCRQLPSQLSPRTHLPPSARLDHGWESVADVWPLLQDGRGLARQPPGGRTVGVVSTYDPVSVLAVELDVALRAGPQ